MPMLGSFTRVGRFPVALRADLRPRGFRLRGAARLRLFAVAYEDESFEYGYVEQKQKGVVKWFDAKKGYGFIECDDGSGDVFVHQTSIMSSGYRALRDGEPVEFVLDDSDDGRMKAVQVTGPDGSEPLGMDQSPFGGEMRESSQYSSEPNTERGRFSSGLQVVVHNLPWSVSDGRLQEAFAEFNALEAQVQYDDLGRSRGYGVVKFESTEDAERAIEAMHMTNLDGRNVMVRFDRYG